MRRQIAMIMMTLFCMLILFSPAKAEEAKTWMYWVELAIQENPEYQLVLADYQLSLQDLQIEERSGFKVVNLSITPPNINRYGVDRTYSMGINYSGQLPYQIRMSGATTLGKKADGQLQVQSGFQLSFNLRDLRNAEEQPNAQMKYLDEWNRVKVAEVNLIQTVIRNYYSFLRLPLQRDLIRARWELAEIQFSQAKLDYERGQITALSYYQAEDAYAAAQASFVEGMQDQESVPNEFAKLFGRKGTDPLFQSKGNWTPDLATLKMTQIDRIVAEWDEQSMDLYFQKNYSYQKSLDALTRAETNLKSAKEAAQWNFNLNAAVGNSMNGVGTSVQVDPFYMQGSITLSKDLFNPSTRINIEKAKIQLERQKVATEELKNNLTQNLTMEMAKIERAKEKYHKVLAEWSRWQDRRKRVGELYEAGYTSKEDWLTVQIVSYEQSVKLIQAEEEWILVRLQLGAILGLESI